VPIANRSSSKRAKRGSTRAGRDRKRGVPGDEPANLTQLIAELGAVQAGEHWVVSCYLKLEPRDRARGKYLIKLKNRTKRLLEGADPLGLSRAARRAVEADLDRIRAYLETPAHLPTGRGIAIFSSGPLDLFSAIPLAQVFRSRMAVDHTPLVRELAALDDEFGRVVCAVYDRTSARFFEVSAGAISELPALPAGQTTRTGRFHASSESRNHRNKGDAGRGVGGSALGEHNFNARIREEKQRHYAGVAERVFQLTRDRRVAGVVLGGTGADAAAVEPFLHPYVRDALLGTVRLNPKSVSPVAVMESVLGVARQHEREWEARHVRELAEGIGEGWAVNGIAASLAALARGQVRTLLVDPTAERAGFRCFDAGHLVVERTECVESERASPVPDVVDDAIEEALRQGSHVDVVEDPDARRAVDGLAALLRFKLG